MGDHQRDEPGWAGTFVRLAALVVAMAAGFVITPWLGIAVAVLGLALLVHWHARAVAYRCPRCGNVFAIPTRIDLVSPHGASRRDGRWVGWKLLRCPRCRRWSRAGAMQAEARDTDAS